MDMSRESSSKAKYITACKLMKNSQEGSSSSKVETMNEYQQEAEVTKSQGLGKASEISSSMENSQEGSSSSKVETMNEYQQEDEVTKSQGLGKASEISSSMKNSQEGSSSSKPETMNEYQQEDEVTKSQGLGKASEISSSMKNSQEGSSSSKVETMNEYQQEDEVTKSQGLGKASEISSSMKNSQEGSSSSKVETMNEYQQEDEVTKSQGLGKASEISSSMKNSQEGSSSSKVETMNEYQQEAEVTESQGLGKESEISSSISDSDSEISDFAGECRDCDDEISSEESLILEVHLSWHRKLYRAAIKGDWETTKMIIDNKSEALTAKISTKSMTVLHVAAYSSNCNCKFVEKLVEMMTEDQVAVVDVNGNTALHYAASTAAVDVADALLKKNDRLTEVQGSQGFIPLLSAVVYGAAKGKEMVRFLASKTKNPFAEAKSTHLLLELTRAGFHDITLDLLHRYHKLVATADVNEGVSSILSVLTDRPMDFRSGTRLNFWETWIYQLAPCQPLSGAIGDVEDPSENSDDPKEPNPQARARRVAPCQPLSGAKGDVEDPSENSDDPKEPNPQARATRVCKWFKRHIWKIITTLAPSTCQKFLDLKCRHKYALELVTCIFERAKEMPNEDILSYFVHKEILKRAAESGIVEIIKVCLHHFPDIISIQSNGINSWNRTESWKTVLDVAVERRRELVFNLLYKRTELCTVFGEPDENDFFAGGGEAMHGYQPHIADGVHRMFLAAKLAPSHQLKSIPGTALQMQRELQWYKEVEKLAHPSEKIKKYFKGHTPREIFTIQHQPLVFMAEKWMKDTSNSCMVVTSLVATVVFAAAFTVPGGNNSQGVPIFLKHKPFTVFIISDALALFSALTSVLMFLSILTSRYAEEDFLKKLPTKLLIGLVSLFFAIATMMIAFVAALWIVLDDKFKWVSIPVTILASIPVTVFLSLQLPLCFQIYKSTFIGIFHPENIW